MSTSTAAFATADSQTVQADEKDSLWTSDSERGLTAHSDAVPEPVEAAEPEAEPQPSPVGTTDDTTPEPTAEAKVTPDRDEKGQFVKGKGKPRSDPRARVEAATAKEAAAKEEARQAKEEAARLRAELETARRPAQPTPQPVQAAPPTGRFPAFDVWSKTNPDKDFDDYTDARAAHVARQEWAKADQERTLAQKATSYRDRMTAAKAADPELAAILDADHTVVDDALVARGLQRFPDAIMQAVFESERAPEILKYFAAHPQDAAQLAVDFQGVPVSAAVAVRRALEASLPPAAVAVPDSAPGVRPSAARPPINRVGGTATATPVESDDLDFGPEYIRRENEKDRKAKAAGRW